MWGNGFKDLSAQFKDLSNQLSLDNLQDGSATATATQQRARGESSSFFAQQEGAGGRPEDENSSKGRRGTVDPPAVASSSNASDDLFSSGLNFLIGSSSTSGTSSSSSSSSSSFAATSSTAEISYITNTLTSMITPTKILADSSISNNSELKDAKDEMNKVRLALRVSDDECAALRKSLSIEADKVQTAQLALLDAKDEISILDKKEKQSKLAAESAAGNEHRLQDEIKTLKRQLQEQSKELSRMLSIGGATSDSSGAENSSAYVDELLKQGGVEREQLEQQLQAALQSDSDKQAELGKLASSLAAATRMAEEERQSAEKFQRVIDEMGSFVTETQLKADQREKALLTDIKSKDSRIDELESKVKEITDKMKVCSAHMTHSLYIFRYMPF